MRKFFALLCCVCALAIAGAVQPVYASGLTVSGNDMVANDTIPVLFMSDSGITAYSSYDVYYGSISSTYVEYMRGYLSKLTPKSHYVGARVGQYDYIFAYGEELVYNGSIFSGAATVVRWNTYNGGSFSAGYDGSFYLNPGSYLVYSDLTDKYPALATSSDFTLRQILILFTIFSLGLTVHSMYQVRKIRRIGRRRKKQ